MTAAPGGDPLILIADDDEDILELVSFRLEVAGFEVVCANDGDEALQIARDRRPAMAILDIRMPGLSGIEVTEAIRESDQTAQIPILLLTASVQEATIAEGFVSGADDYMKKPFNPPELIARVKAVLRRHSGRSAA